MGARKLLRDMRALAIVHQPDAGAGIFADAAREAGAQLDTWLIAENAEPPSSPSGYDAVLSFGGAMDTHEEQAHPWLVPEKELLAELLDRGVPLLGACLGTQLLVEAGGGEVRQAAAPEIGWVEVELLPEAREDPLLAPLPTRFDAFQWHTYEAIPSPGATVLARSAVCPQAYRIGESAYGIQFHAEVAEVDANRWIDAWREDESAVRIRLDPEALRAETRRRIGAWNRLGRALCARFLGLAARTSGARVGGA